MKNLNHKTKLISLAVLFALYGQLAIGCSSCDTKEIKETKACPCSQPQPKPTTETKACPCSQKPPKPEQDTTKVTAEIAVGELADKITILEIKAENITDPNKLKNIHTELATLKETFKNNVEQTPELKELKKKLKRINEQLWDIEDDIRDKERNKEFDQDFIELARSVYYTNDERCATKRRINEVTGSRLLEEKSYSDYK